MTNQRSPDGRLVYLHCSSIFSGANSQVRKAKTISRLLEKHKASIKILTKEFTLPTIAAVAKELLEERIFESLPRAKLRYPELFQAPKSREAERAASEVEVLRNEAEALQDIVSTYDVDGGDLDFEQGAKPAKAERTSKGKVKASETVRTNAVSIPALHPVCLPFKTQHNILVFVQHLLEECCFEFGNTWVPDLMDARKWDEVESVELNQWTYRFLKHVKSLPPSAINLTAGKSITEVLLGTNTIRHSAVHRLPTSAAGILNMLSAAIAFTEALKFSRQTKKITDIKVQLESSMEEIVQYQTLLERKLTDQLEEITRRRAELDRQRAELDKLERSSIEEMLAEDKKQRAEVGAAFETILAGTNQVSDCYTRNHLPSFHGLGAGSGVRENIKRSDIGSFHPPPFSPLQTCNSRIEDRSMTSEVTGMAHDQEIHWEDENNSDQELDGNDVPLQADQSGSGAGEVWEERVSPAPNGVFDTDAIRTPRKLTQKTDRKRPRKGMWNMGVIDITPPEPCDKVEEAAPFVGPPLAVSEEAIPFAEPLAVSEEAVPFEELLLAASEGSFSGKRLLR